MTLVVAWLLLATGLSGRMRELAERLSKRKPLQTFFYSVQYFVVVFILSFPVTFYIDFLREHRYGLSHQPFGQWLGKQFIELAVWAILFSLFFVAVFGLIRKKAQTWWLWGSGVGIMPIIADERFIMSRDMETNPVQKLDGVHHFEVPFLPLGELGSGLEMTVFFVRLKACHVR